MKPQFGLAPSTNNVAEAILSGGDADAPAVWFARDLLTHRQLRARVQVLSARLLVEDLAKGDRVGLLAENGFFFVAAYLAVIRSGLCVVPLPVDCSDRAFQRIAAATGMKHILVSKRFCKKVLPLAEQCGVQPLAESDESSPHAEGDIPPIEVDPRRDLAAIMLTSGSTGEPKGVIVSHRNIECNTQDIIEYMDLAPQDRVMVVLPFYYCYGASLLHTHLAAGGSLVVNNRFLFPETVLEEMAEKQCTGLAGVPSTYQILLRRSTLARREFPALRWVQQAGGKLPDPFIRELRLALPDVRPFIMYGQTEATARLSYLPPERLDDKLGSIGRGLPNTRLEVLGNDGRPVVPGSEDVGQIVASGENITAGYWDDSEETKRYFRDGKLLTGDMARVDEDGYIFLVERARDFIKAMGNRVSPKEIEDVISEIPQVVEVAVVGVPHEIFGEAIRAFVVCTPRSELSVDEVQDQCRKQLPNYKVPQYVDFLPRLPKTGNQKVAKEELRKLPPPEDATDGA